MAFLLGTAEGIHADEAQWIWSSGSNLSTSIPEGETCLFRKTINLRVASEVPFEQISSTHIEDRALTPGSTVTFNLADGRSWRYEIQKWANLRGALPEHLRGT